MFVLHEPEGLTVEMNTADAPTVSSSKEAESVLLWLSASNKRPHSSCSLCDEVSGECKRTWFYLVCLNQTCP